MNAVIYKVLAVKDWRNAVQEGVYSGSADDRRDGFIHFSTAEQLPGTLHKHFAGQDNLLLVAVEAAALAGKLKWQPSRGGALFPHYFGGLDPALASWAKPIGQTASGFDLTSLLDGAST